MRRFLLLIFWQLGLLASGRLFADIVTLKDGRQISGVVETGNIQELHIKVGDHLQTIDIHEVQAIQFGISLPAPPPPKGADLAPAGTTTVGIDAGSRNAGLTSRGKVETGSVESPAGSQAELRFTGKGLKNAPGTPFTNWLTQPAFLNSKRGVQ